MFLHLTLPSPSPRAGESPLQDLEDDFGTCPVTGDRHLSTKQPRKEETLRTFCQFGKQQEVSDSAFLSPRKTFLKHGWCFIPTIILY